MSAGTLKVERLAGRWTELAWPVAGREEVGSRRGCGMGKAVFPPLSQVLMYLSPLHWVGEPTVVAVEGPRAEC